MELEWGAVDVVGRAVVVVGRAVVVACAVVVVEPTVLVTWAVVAEWTGDADVVTPPEAVVAGGEVSVGEPGGPLPALGPFVASVPEAWTAKNTPATKAATRTTPAPLAATSRSRRPRARLAWNRLIRS